MVEHYSHKIQNVIQKELFKAQESIKIAVAWFTNDLLFQPLLLKLETGVAVELVLNKDEINDSDENDIDFKSFVEAGGALHWNMSQKLMHEKFCIIDNSTVIYGSYNWTNKAEYNDESIAVSKEEESTLEFYKKQFEKLCNIYPAETCERAIVHSRFDPFGFDKGEMVLDLFNVLVYRWIVNEKYVYRIFSKETKKQICLYDFEDVSVHPNTEVPTIGVKRNKKWFFYSLVNNILGTTPYGKIDPIKNDTRFWIRQKGWGIADENGNEKIECEYDNLTANISSPIVILKKDGLYGVAGIDDFEYGCQFQEVKLLNGKRFFARKGDKWGVYTGECCQCLLNHEYDEIESILDDYYIIRKDKHKGLATSSGVKMDCVFEEINHVGNYHFVIKHNGKVGYYANDRVMIPCEYDELNPDGYTMSYKKGKAGIVSEEGEILVGFKYSQVKYFNFYDGASEFFLTYSKQTYGIWKDGREIGTIPETEYALNKYIPEFSLFESNNDPFLEQLRLGMVRSIYEQIVKSQDAIEYSTYMVRFVGSNKFDRYRGCNNLCYKYTHVTHRKIVHRLVSIECKEWPLTRCCYSPDIKRFSEGDLIEVSKSFPVIQDSRYNDADGNEVSCEHRYVIVKIYSPSLGTTYYSTFNPWDIRNLGWAIDSKGNKVSANGSAVELYRKVCQELTNQRPYDEVFNRLTQNRTKDCKIHISKVIAAETIDHEQRYIYTYDIL